MLCFIVLIFCLAVHSITFIKTIRSDEIENEKRKHVNVVAHIDSFVRSDWRSLYRCPILSNFTEWLSEKLSCIFSFI